MVMTTSPTRSGPFSRMISSSLATSMFPLNLQRRAGSLASGTTQSMGRAPARMTWARVVSKNILEMAYIPSFKSAGKSTFSAARPWWTGWIYPYPKMSMAASRSLK